MASVRNRGGGAQRTEGNDELETAVDATDKQRSPPPYSGGVVCLLATILVVALLAVVVGGLVFNRISALDAKLQAILPNATQLLAEQQTAGMRAVREAAETFRKRQQPPV